MKCYGISFNVCKFNKEHKSGVKKMKKNNIKSIFSGQFRFVNDQKMGRCYERFTWNSIAFEFFYHFTKKVHKNLLN